MPAGPFLFPQPESNPSRPSRRCVGSPHRDHFRCALCRDHGHLADGQSALRQRKWGLIRLASPIVLLALWQLGSAIGLIPQDVLPAPSLIVEAGIELIENGQLADALQVSGVRVVEGLILGGLIGVALGVAVGLSRWFEATVDPPMQMVRALPHLGLIPLFILWFGIGELPKVLLVALGVSFPLYLNTFSAIRQVDPKLFETAQVLGFSFWQRFRTIICRAPRHRCWSGCVSRWPSPGSL